MTYWRSNGTHQSIQGDQNTLPPKPSSIKGLRSQTICTQIPGGLHRSVSLTVGAQCTSCLGTNKKRGFWPTGARLRTRGQPRPDHRRPPRSLHVRPTKWIDNKQGWEPVSSATLQRDPRVGGKLQGDEKPFFSCNPSPPHISNRTT